MHLAPLAYVHWIAGFSLELLVCVLALWRGVFRRLPFFTVYLVLLIAQEIVWALIYHSLGPDSPRGLAIYWGMQAALTLARGAAVAEICWRVLSPYEGVWKLSRGVLVVIAAILLASAISAARGSAPFLSPMILTAGRGLELAVVGVLLFMLAFCRYYRIPLDRVLTLVALGLGLYSAIQVANNTLLREFRLPYFAAWNQVRIISFELALVVWCLALRKPLPAAQAAPVMLGRGVYDQVSLQMSEQLRVLNSRLLEMLR